VVVGADGRRQQFRSLRLESATYKSTVQPIYQITIDGGVWMGRRKRLRG